MINGRAASMTRQFAIFSVLFTVFPAVSMAASFDCAKAVTKQEKMICADQTLSKLDEKLAQAYKTAVSESVSTEAIQHKQQTWLHGVRDKCGTKPCLVETYEKRIKELTSRRSAAPTTSSSCPVSEKTLIGSWKNVSGGPFEEMTFGYEGSQREFNSWLHQRPEIAGGAWQFENCTIQIRHPTEEEMSFVLTVVRFDGTTLLLREAGEQNDAVYKRIKE